MKTVHSWWFSDVSIASQLIQELLGAYFKDKIMNLKVSKKKKKFCEDGRAK